MMHRKPKGLELLPLLQTQFDPACPYDQQIGDHLRRLIREKIILAHAKLPPIRAMAELWGTNYHTVHDALNRLVAEGYVVIRPVSGCFVAPPRRVLRRVCIYHNYSFGHFSAQEFYTLLNVSLYDLLSQRDIAVVPFYDRRPWNQRHLRPQALRKMISAGEVDAVIAIAILPQDVTWLDRLEVPSSSLMMHEMERRIEIDIVALARKVVDLAVRSGRKRIGLLHLKIGEHLMGRKKDLLHETLEKFAHAAGITVICPDKPVIDKKQSVHLEQLSAWRCDNMFQTEHPPDMLFVYPDDLMRGATISIVKKGIDVPGQILVASHRNLESTFYVPFPMTWFTVKIEDFATGLIEQIDQQMQGKKPQGKLIEVAIEQSSPVPIKSLNRDL